MKLKNFQDLIEECLTEAELIEIEKQAKQEIKYLESLRENVKRAIDDYMKQHNVGFNELVKRLHSNPRQVSLIQQGKVNLTLASLAHIAALLGQEPTIVFKKN